MFRKFTVLTALAAALMSGAAAVAGGLQDEIRFGGVGFGFGRPFGIGLLAIADVRGFMADEFKGTEGSDAQIPTGISLVKRAWSPGGKQTETSGLQDHDPARL